MKPLKPFLLAAGVLAVVLGAIGVFVPGLPTTPLVLLASWCFYRSSPRLQAWLLQSFLGKYIREYRDKGGLTTRKRIYIILLMATMVAISTIFFIKTLPIRIIVWVAGAIGCIVVGFVVPKAHSKH
ncbi:MAG: YbaN family protein [Paludibacteraceae bacterium]|nr:YbaN family protein [Paludibacteraceae bacterium]